MIDLSAVRSDTPACDEIIHFNNAGCALSPQCVTDATIQHLQLEQKIGGYEAANLAESSIQRFYGAFAELLNCQPQEIAYAENATRAWHNAFHAINFSAGDHIVTGAMEYASNYLDLLHLAKLQRCEVSVVPSDQHGLIDLDALVAAIRPNTKLIALTHVASQRGDIQPAAAVGKIARERDILFLLDACQSVGQSQIDVQQIGCDMLCGTGRKYLRGPRGTGFLYVNENAIPQLRPAMIDLHSANWLGREEYELQSNALRFENWERNIANQIGLTVAVDYALQLGINAIEQRVNKLAKLLSNKLKQSQGIEVYERSENLSGIVTFTRDDEAATVLHQRLLTQSINTSVSRTVNARFDVALDPGKDVNRASIHYYNSEEEIERFVDAVVS